MSTVCGPVILGNKIRLQHKWNFPSVYWSIRFLKLDSRFSWCQQRLENQVNANVGELCFVIRFFYGDLNYLDIFWIQAYVVNCVKKANFAVHYVQEMFFRLEKKKIRWTGWILKPKL